MKNIVRSLAILAVVGSIVPFATAAKNPSCPKCKMVLSSKKDKGHTIAVKIKGHTYYCCAACGAHKPVLIAKHKIDPKASTNPKGH